MAADLPIVATAVGDIPVMVSTDNRPLIVERDDEAAFTAALDTLAQRPDLRRSMGRANRERAAAEYDEARMIERHGRLHGEALACTRGAIPASVTTNLDKKNRKD